MDLELARGNEKTIESGLSPTEIGSAIRALKGEVDVTATVSGGIGIERVFAAVTGAKAFLGMQRGDVVAQFMPTGSVKEGTQRFLIGGQVTDIEARYVVDVETAALVVERWARGDEQPAGSWERR